MIVLIFGVVLQISSFNTSDLSEDDGQMTEDNIMCNDAHEERNT